MADKKWSQDRQIVIAGQKFTARFSWLALGGLRDLHGLKTMNDVYGWLANMQASGVVELDQCAQLIWALLRKHHRDITIEELVELLDDHGIANTRGLMEEVSDTIKAAQPPQEAAATKNPHKGRANSISTSSSPNAPQPE